MAKHGSTALSIGLGAAILYLGAHAVTGRQGLMAYVELQGREQALEQRLDTLKAEREHLADRAGRLQPQTLDLDYLDERARVLLAASDPEEIVFDLSETP
jgi:cell division protein FtsB